MPKAARRTSGPKEATKTGPYPSPSSRNSTSSNASSFLDIQLPGSDTHSVPVYDTCDEIRAKTSAFLESKHPIPGATTKNGKEKPYNKKVFCEHIGGVNSNSLRRFLEGEGEASGAENGAYYGA